MFTKIFSPLSINRKEPNLGLQDHRGHAVDTRGITGHVQLHAGGQAEDPVLLEQHGAELGERQFQPQQELD